MNNIERIADGGEAEIEEDSGASTAHSLMGASRGFYKSLKMRWQQDAICTVQDSPSPIIDCNAITGGYGVSYGKIKNQSTFFAINAKATMKVILIADGEINPDPDWDVLIECSINKPQYAWLRVNRVNEKWKITGQRWQHNGSYNYSKLIINETLDSDSLGVEYLTEFVAPPTGSGASASQHDIAIRASKSIWSGAYQVPGIDADAWNNGTKPRMEDQEGFSGYARLSWL